MTEEMRDSPYQGLIPYDERDFAYFFGREKETRLITADLFASPLTLLYGASGVGKSSVLRAGVAHHLRPRDDVLVVTVSGWHQFDPIGVVKHGVLEAIAKAAPPPSGDSTLSEIEFDPLETFLPRCARLVDRRLMIILDQFEGYWLYHPTDKRFPEEFARTVALSDLKISFLISLREDALAKLDHFEGRIPALFDNYRRIEHLDRAAAGTAIVGPLQRYHQERTGAVAVPEATELIESALVDAVLEQVQTGKVEVGQTGSGTVKRAGPMAADRRLIETPYLQLVMSRLWNEERRAGSFKLHWKTLQALGNASQIVRSHLDAVMAKFSPEQQDIAAQAFRFLVTPSGTKIAHTAGDLATEIGADDEALRRILDALTQGSDRILRPVAPLAGVGGTRYEIFHDRLAPAIIDWRARFSQEQALLKSRRIEAEQRTQERKPEPIGSEQAPAPLAGPAASSPPYRVIRRLLQQGHVFVVLGAGASVSTRPVDSKWTPDAAFLPLGVELTQVLAEDIGFPVEDLPHSTLPEVASFYQALEDRSELNRTLRKIFNRPHLVPAVHRYLAKICASKPLMIITTTYDTLMEEALEERALGYDLLVNVSDGSGDSLLWQPRGASEPTPMHPQRIIRELDAPCIYKLYGSVNRLSARWDSFVVAEEDMMQMFGRLGSGTLIPPAVWAATESHHALFLGVGMQDWTQRLLFHALRGPRSRRLDRDTRAWAIVRGASTLARRRWQMADIEAFDVDINEFVHHMREEEGPETAESAGAS